MLGFKLLLKTIGLLSFQFDSETLWRLKTEIRHLEFFFTAGENKNKNRTATAKIHTMPSHVCIHSTGGCCLHLTGEGRLGHLSRII